MTFGEYQSRAASTAIYPDRGANMEYPTLGLCGEAGEVAEKVKKIIRDRDGRWSPEDRVAIAKELGDVLWYVAALCHEFHLTMENVALLNVEKLASRAERGAIKGSGDER